MTRRVLFTVAIAGLVLGAGIANADPLELTVNGGFETGTFDGWSLFPSAPEQFFIVSPGSEGNYAAYIANNAPASAALMKNANIGIGIVVPGETITISFDARGSFAAGGVAFAEFFSEIEGGGTSSSEILGGGPLALNPDQEVWTTFSFTTSAGPDVSGGVTIHLTATTGADQASEALVYYDNVSVTVEGPVPVEETTWGAIKTIHR